MNDLQINTQIQHSEANGLYQQIEDIKRQRANLKEEQGKLQDKLFSHIQKHGKLLAYKNDIPYVLTVGSVTKSVLNKKELAEELEVPQKDLNTQGIAELVEEQRLTSDMIRSAIYSESDIRLKARKARKSDIELIFGK
ncbi:hypothetical protein [Lysinibacillus sp.]|uniref:hypothetical protein n=1 Tax=Lysinibacillus sp. TaxID=1869345 RepID=UPI0028A0579A|nr:hypothetical protein [Lysinibacillus sp.]